MPRLPRASLPPRVQPSRQAAPEVFPLYDSDGDDFVNPPRNRVVDGKFTPPTSRCIPLAVWSVSNMLSEAKKEVVRQMGFGGLLEVPNITNYREFNLWLLSRVDCVAQAIRVSNGNLLRFSEKDVNKVLGIPCYGRDLVEPEGIELIYAKEFICKLLKVPDVKHINRKFLYGIFQKEHANPMSEEDIKVFKVAFVIHAVTKFLAPQSMHDNVCARYFRAVISPNEIGKYNWASYVIKDILSAAETVQKKLNDNEKITYINGCVIFLQVLYLDQLDFGGLNLVHNKLPRISVYTEEEIRKRCKLDFVSKGKNEMSQFGKLQIRPSKDICYSSSHADENFNPLQTDGDMYDENKRAAIEMTNVVRIGGDNIKAIFDRAKEEAMQVLMDVTCKVSKIIELRYTQRETLVNLNQKTSATDGGMATVILGSNAIENDSNTSAMPTIDPIIDCNLNQGKPNTSSTGDTHVCTPQAKNGNDVHVPQSIDLNKSMHATMGETPRYIAPQNILIGIPGPCFDLGIESPTKSGDGVLENSSDSLAEINAQMRSIHVGNAKSKLPRGIKDEKETVVPSSPIARIHSSPDMSPRSASREYAQATIVADQMITEEKMCQTEEYPARVKRELPEPTIIDFAPSNHKRRCDTGVIRVSPFELSINLDTAKPSHIVTAIHNWTRNKQSSLTFNSSWVAHPFPALITLCGQNLHELSKVDGFLDNNTCSIYIRRLSQIDQELLAGSPAIGWRHFVNLDFSMHALADEGFWDPCAFRSQFIYDTINYDVSKCEIIFVPVCNLPRCYCYVFHFKKQQVQILDPLNSNSKGNASIVSYHSSVLPVIVKAMQQCMSLFFPDWSADMSKWECCIPDGYIPSITRGSGLYMLHFMKYWNGNSCIKSLAEDNLIEFRKEILFDILQIKPNFAKIPQAIEELLNQNPEIEIVQID